MNCTNLIHCDDQDTLWLDSSWSACRLSLNFYKDSFMSTKQGHAKFKSFIILQEVLPLDCPKFTAKKDKKKFCSFISQEWLQLWYVVSTASNVNLCFWIRGACVKIVSCQYTWLCFLWLHKTISCVLIMTSTRHIHRIIIAFRITYHANWNEK